METFAYKRDPYQPAVTSCISRELAERIANMFEVSGISSPYATDYDASPVESRRPFKWEGEPQIVMMCEGLAEAWGLDVSHILGERVAARLLAERVAAAKALSHAGIAAYCVSAMKERGAMVPESRDLSHLSALAGKPIRQGAKAWQASKQIALRLDQAVEFSFIQEAYADYATCAVPVVLTPDTDVVVCKGEVAAFCEAIRTTNGLAGYGSSWEAKCFFDTADSLAGFIVLTSRSSIPD